MGDPVEIDQPRQELVEHDPLVVPAHDGLRLLEPPHRRIGRVGDLVDHPVVELQEQEVQLRDDGVLVVARIADQRPTQPVARQVALVLGQSWKRMPLAS
jgi:hypothetical protein